MFWCGKNYGVLVLRKRLRLSLDPVKEVYPGGKTWPFQIEPTAQSKNNLVKLKVSVNEELTSPMYIRDDFVVYEGMTFTAMHIDIGHHDGGRPDWLGSQRNGASQLGIHAQEQHISQSQRRMLPYNSYLQSQCQGGNSAILPRKPMP